MRYDGKGTLLHLIPSSENYELEGVRVVGTIVGEMVGIDGDRVLLITLW